MILESAAGPSTNLVLDFLYHTRGGSYRGVKNGPKMPSFVALYRKIDQGPCIIKLNGRASLRSYE